MALMNVKEGKPVLLLLLGVLLVAATRLPCSDATAANRKILTQEPGMEFTEAGTTPRRAMLGEECTDSSPLESCGVNQICCGFHETCVFDHYEDSFGHCCPAAGFEDGPC